MSLSTEIIQPFQIFIPPLSAWPAIVIIMAILYHVWQQIKLVNAHLEQEHFLLSHCREQLHAVQKQAKPVTSAEIGVWLSQAQRDSVTARGIKAMWAARFASNPDLEAIGSMLHHSESPRLSFLRTAPNLLLLAGLLGTVIGLAGMVSTLGPQIQGTLNTADPLVLTRNLGATLHHMRNAFACTTWGIIAAITVSFVTRKITSRHGHLLAQVEEFGICEFAPMVFPRTQASQLLNLENILQQSRQFLSQVTTIMNESAVHFDKVLSSAGQSMHEGVRNLQGVATGMQGALTEVARDVNDSAQALQQSTETFTDSAKSLNEYHHDLRNAYAELRTLFDESQAKLENQVQAQLQQIREMHHGFDSSADRIMGQLQQTSADLEAAISAFSQAGNQFVAMGLKAETRLASGFDGVSEQLATTLREHRQEMGHVDDGVRLVADRLSNLAERLDPRLLPVDEWKSIHDVLTQCAELLTNSSGYGSLHQSGVSAMLHDGSETYIDSPLSADNFCQDIREMRASIEAIRQMLDVPRLFLGFAWPWIKPDRQETSRGGHSGSRRA